MLTTNPENYRIHVGYHSFDGLMDIQSYKGHTIGHSVYKYMENFLFK